MHGCPHEALRILNACKISCQNLTLLINVRGYRKINCMDVHRFALMAPLVLL